jgi:hypothetical protein
MFQRSAKRSPIAFGSLGGQTARFPCLSFASRRHCPITSNPVRIGDQGASRQQHREKPSRRGAEPHRGDVIVLNRRMLSLAEISDRREIQQLLVDYSTAIDNRRFDDLDRVFTPDAYIDQ